MPRLRRRLLLEIESSYHPCVPGGSPGSHQDDPGGVRAATPPQGASFHAISCTSCHCDSSLFKPAATDPGCLVGRSCSPGCRPTDRDALGSTRPATRTAHPGFQQARTVHLAVVVDDVPRAHTAAQKRHARGCDPEALWIARLTGQCLGQRVVPNLANREVLRALPAGVRPVANVGVLAAALPIQTVRSRYLQLSGRASWAASPDAASGAASPAHRGGHLTRRRESRLA